MFPNMFPTGPPVSRMSFHKWQLFTSDNLLFHYEYQLSSRNIIVISVILIMVVSSNHASHHFQLSSAVSKIQGYLT